MSRKANQSLAEEALQRSKDAAYRQVHADLKGLLDTVVPETIRKASERGQRKVYIRISSDELFKELYWLNKLFRVRKSPVHQSFVDTMVNTYGFKKSQFKVISDFDGRFLRIKIR